MKAGYSWTELIEMAIQVEKAGEEYYRRAASTIGGEMRDSLTALADAERRHAEIFHSMLPKGFGEGTKGITAEETEPYVEVLVSRTLLRYLEEYGEMVEKAGTAMGILDFALGFEEESVRFYQSLRNRVTSAAGPVIEKVIVEEKKHIENIKTMMDAISS